MSVTCNVINEGVCLCNLGHGPFSHLFDKLFMPAARPKSPWKVSTTSLDYVNHELAILQDMKSPKDIK